MACTAYAAAMLQGLLGATVRGWPSGARTPSGCRHTGSTLIEHTSDEDLAARHFYRMRAVFPFTVDGMITRDVECLPPLASVAPTAQTEASIVVRIFMSQFPTPLAVGGGGEAHECPLPSVPCCGPQCTHGSLPPIPANVTIDLANHHRRTTCSTRVGDSSTFISLPPDRPPCHWINLIRSSAVWHVTCAAQYRREQPEKHELSVSFLTHLRESLTSERVWRSGGQMLACLHRIT